MSINLNKTEKKSINLTKTNPSLDNITVHLWWKGNTSPIDCDISAFILSNTENGPKLIQDEKFVFYGNESSPQGSVWKTPDERAGGTEELYVKLSKLDPTDDEVSLIVTIFQGNNNERNHSFGMITDAGIKILNSDTGEEIAFYDLDAQFSNETAVQVGSFFRQNGEFTFQAVGAGFKLGLGDFVTGYGGQVA